jgi:hypothetical protein
MSSGSPGGLLPKVRHLNHDGGSGDSGEVGPATLRGRV